MFRETLLFVFCLIGFALVNSIPFQGPIEDHQRIVNGEKIDIKEAPFMAMLISKYGTHTLLFTCGGSILDSRHILTAAHCIGKLYKVVLGSTTTQLPHGQEIVVKSQTRHPLYDEKSTDYDYGIVELMEEINFNDAVKPLQLTSSADYVPPEEMLWTYGWGLTHNYTDSRFALRKVGLLSKSQKDCQTAFEPHTVTDRMMCAGIYSGKGTCDGDSGGPLIYNGVQVGITSWGLFFNCVKPGGVSARVGAELDWIKKMISK